MPAAPWRGAEGGLCRPAADPGLWRRGPPAPGTGCRCRSLPPRRAAAGGRGTTAPPAGQARAAPLTWGRPRLSGGAGFASAAGPALVRGGGDPAGTTTAKRSPARGQRAARPAPLSASGRRASRGRPEHPPRSGCGPRGVSALPLPAGWLAARSPGPYSVKI